LSSGKIEPAEGEGDPGNEKIYKVTGLSWRRGTWLGFRRGGSAIISELSLRRAVYSQRRQSWEEKKTVDIEWGGQGKGEDKPLLSQERLR